MITGIFLWYLFLPRHVPVTICLRLLLLSFGVNWWIANEYRQYILELDFLLIANMLIQRDTGNCKVYDIIETTLQLPHQSNYKVVHSYREANKMPDGLSKLEASYNDLGLFQHPRISPSILKGTFQLDRSQLPSVRIRYDKANFLVNWSPLFLLIV